MTFNITTKDKLKYLYKPIFIIFLLSFIFALLLKYLYNYDFIMFLKIFLGTFAGQSLLFFIPLSIFYYNYFKKDKNTSLTIENEGSHFSYQNRGAKVLFSESDIEKVVLYLSPPLFDKRSTWLYWDDYFYSEIITVKESIKISCLVINNIEDYIKEYKIERRKVYFPLIKEG